MAKKAFAAPLRQLGRSKIRYYKQCPGVRKRAVDVTQNRFGGIAGDAYHDAVRRQRILAMQAVWTAPK